MSAPALSRAVPGWAAPTLLLLARLAPGAVMIVAGALKVTRPETSAMAVRAYQVFDYDVAGYIGYALPTVEIILGVLLVLGLFTRTAATLTGVLLLAFIAGIASAWARGLSIDCGCFGGGGTVGADQTRYLSELARDAALLACCALTWARNRSPLQLEHALFRQDRP